MYSSCGVEFWYVMFPKDRLGLIFLDNNRFALIMGLVRTNP